MTNKQLKTLFKTCKEDTLFGRYIHTKSIKSLLEKHSQIFEIDVLGYSVLKEKIHSITIGAGEQKILMWSQMHGNESTTTKALFDLFNFLASENVSAKAILDNCTLNIIPILNPDGAKAYTRLNANAVDLNRDAQNLSQPESKLLREVFNAFKPHYCFNLHGQRTIFSAGEANKVATVSFLSPAQDNACVVTKNREVAMSLINDMNSMLQVEIPNQVGIYDDAFNINCVGDTFQSLNVSTVLFEAGHYKDDYDREEVRRYMFQSLVVAINAISTNRIHQNAYKLYSLIPENKKLFFDIIIRNARIDSKILDIGIQYVEELIENEVKFIPKVKKIDTLDKFYAHRTIDANNSAPLTLDNRRIEVDSENDFVMINNAKYVLNIK